MVKKTFISLGSYCEVAYQIRKHTGVNHSHYFDWLVTPFNGLIYTLMSDFNCFNKQNLILSNCKAHVIDTETNIRYNHAFDTDGAGHIPPDFKKQYAEIKDKFNFLKQRFIDTIKDKNNQIYFARRQINSVEAKLLIDFFQEKYPKNNFQFIFINNCEFKLPIYQDKIISLTIPTDNDSLGDSEIWADLLIKNNLIESGFQLSNDQIVRKNNLGAIIN